MKQKTSKTDKIKLNKEQKEAMVAEIKNYFLKERDEEIGDLAASFLLNFIVEKFGPEFYNQGVYDSCNYMKDKSEDLLSIQIL